MTTHALQDTTVLTRRSLRHIARSPDTIITTAVTPVALMLLFVYVLGGAIDVGSGSYIDYMLPGILLITIASGVAYTAYRLFLDMQGGIFERFQSMPIARSSVLWAHVLTSLAANLVSMAVVVGVALIMGFRTGASLAAWLAVAAILTLFTLALTWIAVIAGLSANYSSLVDEVRRVKEPPPSDREPVTISGMLEGVGRSVAGVGGTFVGLIDMLGAVLAAAGNVLIHPRSFRLTSTIHHLEQVCWRAVPIIVLITFLIGCIISQQGIFHFRQFGADIFVVDMLGVLVLLFVLAGFRG